MIEGMDDDKMATLMQTPIQEVASDVCGKVSDYIKVLENVYSEVKQGKPT